MSSIPTSEASIDVEHSAEETFFSSLNEDVQSVLKPLASLKLTVVLFAISIFLVLAGTLAQVEKDIWDVVAGYFRCWISWIELQVFFPKTWFPHLQNIPGGFWFPGGWTIGTLMTLNLLAAHSIRFKIQAKGDRLLWGSVVTGIGMVLTWAVIEFGTARDAIYETASGDWSIAWMIMQYGLLVPAIGCGFAASRFADNKQKRAEFITYAAISLISLGISVFLIAGGDAVRLNNSAMRIMWQLIQATFAGLVLLGGCLLLFKKRAGVVLLHTGVLLILANEVVVHSLHEEANMVILEGETTNFVRDIRHAELAIVDRSAEDHDQQTVIPADLLKKNIKAEQPIQHPDLPFDVKVTRYVTNADLKPRAEGDENPSDYGLGLTHSIVELDQTTGMDTNADYPAAYVELIDKSSGKALQTLAVSALATTINRQDKVTVQDQEYEVALRFKRIYKPYSIHLIDVRKDDYIGTSTPMNYSSDIRLVDKSRNEDRKVKIWMNNPLRFAGETFYQSGYQVVGDREMTTLQVVTNEGWMIPYVACMIVAIGSLFQFGLTLIRFLNRIISGRTKLGEEESEDSDQDFDWSPLIVNSIPAILILGVSGSILWSLAKPPAYDAKEFNYFEFGKIPVVYEGRVKPIDTLARNTMRILCARESVSLSEEDGEKEVEGTDKRAPRSLLATQWLLEMLSNSEKALERDVIRIVNEELRSTLDLERRKSHRYSLEELRPKMAELEDLARETRDFSDEKGEEYLSIYQRKVMELTQKLFRIRVLSESLKPVPLDMTRDDVQEQMMAAFNVVRILDEQQPPLLIPPTPESEGPDDKDLKRDEWETYSKSYLRDLLYPLAFKSEPNPFSGKFGEIILAYEDQDAEKFNQAVREYHSLLKQHKIADVSADKLEQEALFNSASMFFYSGIFYVLAFVIAVVSWLHPILLKPGNRAAWLLMVLLFVVHSISLVTRVSISGRPPVTNLYSSAVFIGWAGVLFGLIIEWILKMGIGNVLASIMGFASLWIAHGLAGDGDTFTVLQAVLDTQFWLSTHVVCITLGYAATYVAGILGVIYICRRNPLSLIGVLLAVGTALGLQQADRFPALVRTIGPFLIAIPLSLIPTMLIRGASDYQMSKAWDDAFSRMIYGTLCFAVWLSFVGTVLGGLWADDSWGRFWGWDPKENGALIIVLWNALVLHARWDRMVKVRGLAMLAVAGNITTTWSWFGVNELGVGLHSYGFTEGVLYYLTLVVLSQLALICICAFGTTPDEQPDEIVVEA